MKMKMTDILSKSNGTITITTFANGYGVETSGRDLNDSWHTGHLIFCTLEEALSCVQDITSMPPCN